MPAWEAEVNLKTPKSPHHHQQQQKHIKVNISEHR